MAVPLPDPIQRIVERARKKGRPPFMLVAPDERVFIAHTFEDLVRMTAREFDPSLVLRPKEKDPEA